MRPGGFIIVDLYVDSVKIEECLVGGRENAVIYCGGSLAEAIIFAGGIDKKRIGDDIAAGIADGVEQRCIQGAKTGRAPSEADGSGVIPEQVIV